MPRVTMVRCDLREQALVLDAIRSIRPDRVYHLAALSSVKNSVAMAEEVHRTNFWGTSYLLEAVQKFAPHARVLLISSSQVYSLSSGAMPLTETSPLAPQTPYAISKLASELLSYEYCLLHGLFVVRVRPFNHTGPGQSAEFVCSDFARQFAAIVADRQAPRIATGALQLRRDFSDVRDVVRAYELLIEKGEPGEVYNVASAQAVQLESVLAALEQCCGRKVQVVVEPTRIRANDPEIVVGSNAKLRQQTGWEPRYSLQQTLEDLFGYWREELLSVKPSTLPV
jgi:GDP-4-dehydro-6-deoxy-D-mannose reductase